MTAREVSLPAAFEIGTLNEGVSWGLFTVIEGVRWGLSAVIDGVSRGWSAVIVNCWLMNPRLGVTADRWVALKGVPTLGIIIAKAITKTTPRMNKANREYPVSLR